MTRDKSNCRPTDSYAILLGGHKDDMVPLPRYFAVSAIPITELLSKEKIDRIVERTRKADGETVSLLKTGSAFYSPSLGAAAMAETNLKDKKTDFPLLCLFRGNRLQ